MYLPEESLLREWVSADRLSRYAQEREPTSALYLWNAELSSAYFEISGHAEILLRNVFHGRLAPLSNDGRWVHRSPISVHPARSKRHHGRNPPRNEEWKCSRKAGQGDCGIFIRLLAVSARSPLLINDLAQNRSWVLGSPAAPSQSCRFGRSGHSGK